MRFLLIEDNPELAGSVVERLSLDGHGVDHAASLAEADLCVLRETYDLILLDIHLPDGDGRHFLARQRGAAVQTPVIVLTARSAVSDRVSLLDAGADDYITKPVDFAELGARCRAVLRRHGRGAEQLVLGDLVLDPDQVSVRIGRDSITLRNRELRVLQVLARTPERVYSKAQLHDLVFGVLEAVSDNAIEVYVGRVRKAISASRSVRIETVRGVGYRLVRLDTA
jgi:two-component system response regulator TctD